MLQTLLQSFLQYSNPILQSTLSQSSSHSPPVLPPLLLARKQIETAYTILTEAQTMIKTETGSQGKFLDASNRSVAGTHNFSVGRHISDIPFYFE